MSPSPLLSLLLSPLVSGTAQATAGFDPSTPAAEFTGQETYDQPGEIKLWSRVERIEDPDRTLFRQESFNDALAWPDSADWAPWIATCFGTRTPHSSTALLHMGPHEGVASGTPILMVPGAGDNGVRAFVTLASKLDQELRPVYALTFAHPHGDVFMQAEVIANAIARIKARTGAAQVDVVAHSKGGVAAAVYLASGGTTFDHDDYEAVGTPYRGDVRRAVFVATPLGGIDTAFRWPAGNLASLTAEDALSPTSWTTFYPYSSLNTVVNTPLLDQHIGGGGADYFPGHRQILRRWDDVYDLPGSQSWLGAYAWQTDWWTTYEGGLGYWSFSEGIDEAIDAGGAVLDQVAAGGVDPDVQVFLLAGRNPLMPNGTGDWMSSVFDESWVEVLSGGLDDWGALVAAVIDNSFASLGVTEGELQGLASGDLMLGEISGESDGLVFVESALMAETLTGRGARVVEQAVVDLSHIDLLYASPVTGELLVEAAGDDPGSQWMAALGERYTDADSLGWIERVLEDDDGGGGDTGDGDGGADGGSDGGAGDGGADGGSDGGADGGSDGDTGAADDDTGAADGDTGGAPAVGSGGCGRCSAAASSDAQGLAGLGGWLLVGLLGLRRRSGPRRRPARRAPRSG